MIIYLDGGYVFNVFTLRKSSLNYDFINYRVLLILQQFIFKL